jgi:hypothetical protein
MTIEVRAPATVVHPLAQQLDRRLRSINFWCGHVQLQDPNWAERTHHTRKTPLLGSKLGFQTPWWGGESIEKVASADRQPKSYKTQHVLQHCSIQGQDWLRCAQQKQLRQVQGVFASTHIIHKHHGRLPHRGAVYTLRACALQRHCNVCHENKTSLTLDTRYSGDARNQW